MLSLSVRLPFYFLLKEITFFARPLSKQEWFFFISFVRFVKSYICCLCLRFVCILYFKHTQNNKGIQQKDSGLMCHCTKKKAKERKLKKPITFLHIIPQIHVGCGS